MQMAIDRVLLEMNLVMSISQFNLDLSRSNDRKLVVLHTTFRPTSSQQAALLCCLFQLISSRFIPYSMREYSFEKRIFYIYLQTKRTGAHKTTNQPIRLFQANPPSLYIRR